jgi:hypothetical protein
MKNRSSIFRTIQIACFTAAMTTMAFNIVLLEQRQKDWRHTTTIKSLLDTEREVDRIPKLTYDTIRDHLEPLQYPGLYSHWLLRNLGYVSLGLLAAHVIADRFAKKAARASPSDDLDAPLFQKEESSKSPSSHSSLNTEN